MKKLVPLILLILLLATGCSKDTVLDGYNQLLNMVGKIALTGSLSLEGEREYGSDRYTGTYQAEYQDFNGTETLFGGTGLSREEGNKLTITCKFTADEGKAVLFFSGKDDPEVLCGEYDDWTGTVTLSGGSEYIGICGENFTGSVDLTVE
ncbi:hypothetical protein [Anaerolentibacter hominis]|uniref:hypothetical protein n=1 Tax=Anaerolentibacter hominis TaxID=3079009 RepID=UPI0031B83713